MMMYYCCLLFMTVIGSVASLFLKKAASLSGMVAILMNHQFYIGGFLYFVSALLNIFLLQVLDYSVVLPLTSLTYVWTMILSQFALKEKVSKEKLMGVILILVGAVFVSR